MAFQVSPGVLVQEIDATNVIPAVSSSIGAYCGQFTDGPVDEVITISSQNELVQRFGEPAATDVGAEYFYPAAHFLDYGLDLKVVRINSNGLLNATSGGSSGLLIKSTIHYTENFRAGQAAVGDFGARHAGARGNNLKISVCQSANAFSQSNVTTSNATASIGGTSVPVTAGQVFVVGDIITIGSDTVRYKVTAISFDSGSSGAGDLTIEQESDSTQGLAVAVSSSANISREWEFAKQFTKAPGTSTFASSRASAGSNDEIHIVVLDEDGGISGIPGTILEQFEAVSLASDAKDDFGATNYYVDVLYNESEYVYWLDHNGNATSAGSAAAGVTFGGASLPVNNSFSNGSDGRQPTTGEKILAYDTHFGSADNQDISLMISGTSQADNGSGSASATRAEATSYYNQLLAIAAKRKDCMVFFSPIRTDVVNASSEADNVKSTADTINSTSYAAMDSGWLYIYDRYNDRFAYVPGNGAVAGLCAGTDLAQDSWYSPAGYNRGQIFGVTKLAFNPSQADRDKLYKARVNPIVTFPGQGSLLFGDKTLLSNAGSAFSRINVRRLFIVLEKAISTSAKFSLFEFNDSFTRANFRATIEPFLREVQGRRGIYDFKVICDETNNTGAVIDSNQFVASIFVKPARSINFITLTFVASRTGVDFEEVYGGASGASESAT